VNGVVYQMLWSLLQATRLHIRACEQLDAASFARATIVLEPMGGGGDIVVQTDRRRIIQQVKARSGGGTWSLRSIIEEVVPDLYVAAERGGDARFQFVTESSLGDWKEVYVFFRSLGGRISAEANPSDVLDPANELSFSRGISKDRTDTFWGDGQYSEQRLFDRILATVRVRPTVCRNEDEATTGRKLLQLLANFEFVGGQAQELVQHEIDACLLTLVDHRDDLDRIRKALAFDLAQRATAGEATIEAACFFADHSLSAVPLVSWATLRSRTRDAVTQHLEQRRYSPKLDVRREFGESAVGNWPADIPVLMVTGESGQGKSWTAFAIAEALLNRSALVAIVQAKATADATREEAARAVWQEIAGHDSALTLSRIADRIQSDAHIRLEPWLHLIIDGVQDADTARQLLDEPWRKWRIRPVLTCLPPVARAVARDNPTRCHVIALADFSIEELHCYLDQHLGDEWDRIPEDVRGPLHRPLLANLYVTSVTTRGARPTTEYEVYAAHWEAAAVKGPANGVRLRRLAATALDGGPYPFSGTQLDTAGIDDAMLCDLERIGWLRRASVAGSDRYEFAHDRLLNWACAEALVERLREGHVLIEAAGHTMRSCLNRERTASGRGLGYVAMDTLWLALQDETLRPHAAQLIKPLDERLSEAESLYKHLVPTLGSSVLSALFHLMRERRANSYRIRHLATAASGIGGPETVAEAAALLADDDPLNQRTALVILSKCPSAHSLDRLWQLHCAGSFDSAPFLREHEHRYSWYEESFAALRESVRLDPSWLDRRIAAADGEKEPLGDLAYLLACLPEEPGSGIWSRRKRRLFEKLSKTSVRALARCVDRFSDREETPWLVEQLSNASDLAGPTALRALARLDASVAVEHLERLSRTELALTHSWFVGHLFASCPDSLRAKLLEMMRRDEDPWITAEVYRDRSYLLDEATLDFLLDDLERRLVSLLELPDWGSSEPLYRVLSLLAQACDVDLLRCWERRRGKTLEVSLAAFLLRIGPRRGVSADSLSRDDALIALERISGAGLTDVINSFLSAESRFGRYDAIRKSTRRADDETRRRLIGILESSETWEGEYVEQHEAAIALIELDDWSRVIHFLAREGLRSFRTLLDCVRDGRRPSSDALTLVRESVRTHGAAAAPGELLALGLGNQSDRELVRSALATSEPESSVAHACMIALELLRDDASDSVPLIARELTHKPHELSATGALFVNGSPESLAVLADHYAAQIPEGIAVHLIANSQGSNGILLRVREAFALAEAYPWDQWSQRLAAVLGCVSSEQVLTLLDDFRIRERVRSEAFADEDVFQVTAMKTAALRCLARLDRSQAIRAARATLLNPNYRDREQYALVLLTLDENEAGWLIDQLANESLKSVREGIGRALARVDADAILVSRLTATPSAQLQAVCFVSGWASRGPEVSEALGRLVAHGDDEVSRAAAEALQRIRSRAVARNLADAFLKETIHSKRWGLLDNLLAAADPGLPGQTWPLEGSSIGHSLSPMQRFHVNKVIDSKRRTPAKLG